ncbi:hypothetical protein [Brevundimonas abyssalis]|uniref:hypothetical protein n=1 Tax=Brevundimonas abyssalis TaxID=1125965 RepID=UPI001F55D89E|nr:hypothetical protein [Brevundimonas abyssalis]
MRNSPVRAASASRAAMSACGNRKVSLTDFSPDHPGSRPGAAAAAGDEAWAAASMRLRR